MTITELALWGLVAGGMLAFFGTLAIGVALVQVRRGR